MVVVHAADDPRHETYRVYQFLGFLLHELLEGIGAPDAGEPPNEGEDSVCGGS